MTYLTLNQRLKTTIPDHLKKDLGIKNVHALPTLEKVVLNVGINKSKMDSKEMHQYIQECLMQITGQKPVLTISRKSISNFKVREGMIVGVMVTLRGQAMHDFLDRLLSYTLPRIRDFRGLKHKLDGKGNYAIGLKDHSIFPEIAPPDPRQIFGLQIQLTTTAKNNEDAKVLLTRMGIPFTQSNTDPIDINVLSTSASS